MVEVFKTNVTEQHVAKLLLDELHKNQPVYKANFDLEDCDNILRVSRVNGEVDSTLVIDLLEEFGFIAEVLPDEIPQPLNRVAKDAYTTKTTSSKACCFSWARC